jgi:hypothetical protein
MHRFDATGPPKMRSAPPSPRSYPRGYPAQRHLPDEEILRLYVEEKLDSSTIGIRAECTSTTVLEIVRALAGTRRARRPWTAEADRCRDHPAVQRRRLRKGAGQAGGLQLQHPLRPAPSPRRQDPHPCRERGGNQVD